ncbi:P-loop NTPase fold protein [Conexibacter sp. JD483]|uniref:P-loop NTPase fold protein n=1 Tax=unclassified Conexibacter TaxID=2627773 RepID=UPI0027164F98|nr:MULTISPECIES: P-loop NTPase fold protein [unclassified Conexibacter]MDO8184686.1 P-loop NTPase fold protein [Conexibacter sp. CPCC 205706]MDO8197992.1 P-loop NTPase fold protein [Conexibacter sp. CPCC 205762]MDR9368422.1 P-loop NTPase fold protein [Conexibacter sp. JD483]
MSAESQSARSLSDAAIRGKKQDRFRRGPIAARIAAEARVASAEGGNVIAICGAWGSGKTSIANMAMEELRGDPTCVPISFNPWTFFGADDLILRFFIELGGVLGRRDQRFKRVAERVAAYAGALSSAAKFVPLVGSPGEAALSIVQQMAEATARGDTPTLDDQRERLIEALTEFDGRIVVFLDDIDRLSDDDIRAVVRLVKVVGDLPRISYILSFDKERVEQVLGSPETDPARARERGRAYMEKIVQSEHSVPLARRGEMWDFVLDELEAACVEYSGPQTAEHEWSTIMVLLIKRIGTPREAKRVANAVAAGVYLHGSEIALADIILLEALRVLEPDVHAQLPFLADLFSEGIRKGDAEGERRLEELLAASTYVGTSRDLLGQLFPAIALDLGTGRDMSLTERRERRVSDGDVFSKYIHASLADDQLSADFTDHLFSLADDPSAFGAALATANPDAFGDAIASILDYREHFSIGQGVALAVEVLRSAGDHLSPAAQASRIMVRPLSDAIEQLLTNDMESLEDNARGLFYAAPSLSARYCVIEWFGRGMPSAEDEPVDDPTLSDRTDVECRQALRDEMHGVVPADLAAEPAAFELLRFLQVVDGDSARVLPKLEDNTLMVRILSELPVISFQGQDGTVHKLWWEELEKLCGHTWLQQRIERLSEPDSFAALGDDEASLVLLARGSI